MNRYLNQGRTLAIAAALVGIVTGPTCADEDHDRARRLHQAGKILSLEDVLERARANRPGRILEVKLEDERDRYIYEVQILDAQGRVWEMAIDARTGEVLATKQED